MNEQERIPTHPGEVLKEELESRGISQKRYSELTGVSYTMLNEILNGKRPVTTDFALLVEASLGINPQMLINMQTRYNMALSRKSKTFSERLESIRKICAVL
jgi:addiction module HigA family antidote